MSSANNLNAAVFDDPGRVSCNFTFLRGLYSLRAFGFRQCRSGVDPLQSSETNSAFYCFFMPNDIAP